MKNSILDYAIYEDKLEDISLNSQGFINTINPHSYVVAKRDDVFHKALFEADILLPDGIGIVYAMKILKSKRIRKIAGNDVFIHLMNKLNNKGGSCFFLGSSEDTLNLIEKKAAIDYPNVKVSSFSPPFKKVFSHEDNLKMLSEIDKEKPDILFIGMTAPKQEKWAFQNKDLLNVEIVCCIGAVFDFYAGKVNRAPNWIINLGLEWLFRFFKEPRRLWKRYLINNTRFVFYVLKEKFTR